MPTPAAAFLLTHGHALAALAQAAGGPAAVAVALAGAALTPSDLCAAYASGFDSKTLDASRLLAAARGALDSLDTASHAGCAEAASFLTSALHGGSLYALVFRDAREVQAAVELQLCDETVVVLELACRRASMTVTRPLKPGEFRRTVFTRTDGVPLHSSMVVEEGDELLVDGILDSFELPRSAFSLYAETRTAPGEAVSDSAVVRAQLGERFIAAVSEAFIAQVSVVTHMIGLWTLPAPCLGRLRAIATAAVLTPIEFEGLFKTLGRHQVGIAALTFMATLGSSGLSFARLLDPEIDGLARLLAKVSDPTLDEPTINGCVIVLSYACASSERFAQALVDEGAFKLLQPAIRHNNVVVAVRAAFAVAAIAAACEGAAEQLRWSGVLDVIASALRPVGNGSAVLPGFVTTILPTCEKLLQPGVEPALQLAALHRLGAALTGTTSNTASVANGPLLVALRGCVGSPDAAVAAAAKFVLKELREPFAPPPRTFSTSTDLRATISTLRECAAASAAEQAALVRLLDDSRAAAAAAERTVAEQAAIAAAESEAAHESASATVPDGEEGATRGMLAELLSRGAIPPETPWHAYIRSSISEAQLDALASIGAVTGYGAPLKPVALPDALLPLFLPSTRAALVRFGITL